MLWPGPPQLRGIPKRELKNRELKNRPGWGISPVRGIVMKNGRSPWLIAMNSGLKD
jgi:hypothetical protein